jgi:hypothetical protein
VSILTNCTHISGPTAAVLHRRATFKGRGHKLQSHVGRNAERDIGKLMMRPSHKIALVDAVAREMKRRFSYMDIDVYFGEFKIRTPNNFQDFESEIEYAKFTMRGINEQNLIKIVEDLEISIDASRSALLGPPKKWPDDDYFRLFISHVSDNKDKATRLRDCLEPYYIKGFVAHEDIQPTAEWQIEIERALHSMDTFLAIHTRGFSASYWAQQEVGFAVARGVKMISFKMGEDPTGFISKRQALPRLTRNAEDIAKKVRSILFDDDMTSQRMRTVEFLHSTTKTTPVDDDIPF